MADIYAEVRRQVVRSFQRYDSDQRADMSASHRLHTGQRASEGEFWYSHPAVPGRAFPTRKKAALAALDALTDKQRRCAMAEINWKTSKEDALTIHKIAARASGLVRGHGIMDTTMDVTAVHANGCPLDLDRLLAADDADFAHDIAGIARHLDRTAGKLGDCFVPRFAQREEVASC